MSSEDTMLNLDVMEVIISDPQMQYLYHVNPTFAYIIDFADEVNKNKDVISMYKKEYDNVK